MEHYECIVVGGGMLGATAALGLAQQGRSVALVEVQPPVTFERHAPPDLRVSSINIATVALLQRLAAWPVIARMRMAPFHQVKVWERPSTVVTFSAEIAKIPLLGYIVENRLLQLGVWQQLRDQQYLTVYAPATLRHLAPCRSGWRLVLGDDQTLTTSLVVGADGGNSQVRQQAGIGVSGWQYRQQCLLITVQTAQPQPAITWQRFHPDGPRAFLPLMEGWGSLAWYDTPAHIRSLQSLTNTELSGAIREAYPACLGSVSVHATGSFPLFRQHAAHYCLPGLVLLGDAAHAIHPMVGQGANMGFRDVDALLSVLASGWQPSNGPCEQTLLQRYQRQRRIDNLWMQAAVDFLYRGFKVVTPPLPLLRHWALTMTEHLPPLKHGILQYALGLL